MATRQPQLQKSIDRSYMGVKILVFILLGMLRMQCCEGTARDVTLAENDLAQFACNVENLSNTIWLYTSRIESADSESISQGSLVYPRFGDKYKMETLSYNSTSHELKLKFNVTEEDEGLYLCQEAGTNKAQFSLVVEIPPVLQLKRDNSVLSTTIDVVSNKEVTIECVAEGGKPPVTLSWMVNGQKKIGPVIDNAPPSSDRRVTSVIHYLPTVQDNILSCVTSGQQVIPEKEVSVAVNVQYLPNCVMTVTNTTNAFVITCSCKANPEVQRYEIYVNDSLFRQEMKAPLPSEKSATVFCNATNDVGSFVTHSESLKPFHEEVPIQLSGSALVIGLCVGGATLVLFILPAIHALSMYRKKKRDKEEIIQSYETTLNTQSYETTLKMANRPLPDEYHTIQDGIKPLKGSDKEENPHTEDGSKKPDDHEYEEIPFSTSRELEENQHKLNGHKDSERRKFKTTGKKMSTRVATL